MKYLIFFLLNFALSPFASAEEILSLQQKASFAYEQMKQAEREAKSAEQNLQVKQERLQYFKKMVAEAEKEFEVAQNKSKEANAKMESAKRNWDELSNTLTQEWKKQEGNR